MGTQIQVLSNRITGFSVEEKFDDSINDITLREVIYSVLALIVLLLLGFCVLVAGAMASAGADIRRTAPQPVSAIRHGTQGRLIHSSLAGAPREP
jgi:hypothetical protein